LVCRTCGSEWDLNTLSCPKDGTSLIDFPDLGETYEFLGVIGSGGMGVIYKARHKLLNKLVAIKVIASHSWSNQAVRRFQQEGEAASKLRSPHIIQILNLGVSTSGQ